MTENTEDTTAPADIDIDFDDWINGGERKTHLVTLYARADLYADIEELERQRVNAPKVAEDDESLGGETNPNAELDAKINALWAQLDASKKEFRVSARTDVELKAIRDEVETELKDQADEAAAKARKEAKALAKRLGVESANDINNLVRTKALEASSAVLDKEISVRAIAASTQMRRGDDWVQLGAEQIRTLEAKLGGSQMDILNRAYSRAANEAPHVTVPKS